jgi:hypothetical protein
LNAFGNLENADRWRKPDNWDGKNLDAVKGAQLQLRSLTNVDASNPSSSCAVKRRWSPVGRKAHPGTGSLHPVAIGAVVEVTKLLKPLV